MSIESILNKIEKEAEQYADEQLARAEAARKETLDEARRRAKDIKAQEAKRAESDAAVLKERRASVSDLEARKMCLAAKQDVIEEVFSEAMEKLVELDPDKYIDFILKCLEQFKAEGGEVVLSARDLDRYGKKLSEALSGSGLSVSKETADIKGGFILRKGNVSYNASLEKMIEKAKDEMTPEIAGLLFA